MLVFNDWLPVRSSYEWVNSSQLLHSRYQLRLVSFSLHLYNSGAWAFTQFLFSLLIINCLSIDLLESDNGDAVLDKEMKSLSLHALNNDEDTNAQGEEDSDSSDEDGRLTHVSCTSRNRPEIASFNTRSCLFRRNGRWFLSAIGWMGGRYSCRSWFIKRFATSNFQHHEEMPLVD